MIALDVRCHRTKEEGQEALLGSRPYQLKRALEASPSGTGAVVEPDICKDDPLHDSCDRTITLHPDIKPLTPKNAQ